MSKLVPAWIKPALELGPVVLFFVAYLRLKERVFTIGGTEYEGFIVVTAAFVPLVIASTLLLWRLTGKISPMQIFTAVLVTVFGGMTVWLNDPQFIKMKPTILYLMFAAILGFGIVTGRNLLKSALGEAMPLQDAGWAILTKRFCAFFAGLALANEVIWRTQTEETWVYFKTFGLPVLLIVFMVLQSGVFTRYAQEE